MHPEQRLKRIAATEHRGCGVTGSMTDFGHRRAVGRRVGEGSIPSGPIATHRRVAQG